MPETRSILDNELADLNAKILRLASMVDSAIEKAMLALTTRDLILARTVVANDELINALRLEIEEETLRILATQQPFAVDLRETITAIHLANELERMGDHAAGIARLVERMEEEDDIKSLFKLPKMAKQARKMIAEGIQAYIDRDSDLAERMVARDDKLDKHYRRLFRETLKEMRDDDYIRRATFLLWAGHDLERIGDRATNIAERVIFMSTGKFVENIPSPD